MQVSAHGTGARIPTVDEQVVEMRLVTPALGTITLSESKDPELFRLAKVGLGLLGVASEITLQCVPAHSLQEHTFVASAKVQNLQMENVFVHLSRDAQKARVSAVTPS